MTHLWTDRPEGADHDWLAQQLAAPRRRITPPPPPPPPRRRRGRNALIAAVTAVVIGAAVLAGTQLGGDDHGKSEQVGALPASSGRPAETRINEIYARDSKGVVNIKVT